MADSLRQNFLTPSRQRHRRYEAARACLIDGEPVATVAPRFGYTPGGLDNLCRRIRRNPDAFLGGLFDRPMADATPAPRRATVAARSARVLELRDNEGLSVYNIAARLREAGESWSISTIAGDLRRAGRGKLPRRDAEACGAAAHPTRVATADVRAVDWTPRRFHTEFGGLFLFAGPLVHLLSDALLQRCPMPGSAAIPAGHALRSLLGLKLYGIGRPAHVMANVMDPGLALFAGLNTVPKKSTLSEYSCRTDPATVRAWMQACLAAAHALGLPTGESFDLDFHTIPYHGDQALLDKHYVSKRSRRQLGVLSFLVRDVAANVFCYANAAIPTADAAAEVLRFADYWREQTGHWPAELVFDSGLTTYARLAELDRRGIHFITLRRRGGRLVERTQAAPATDWRRIKLHNLRRAYRTPEILETATLLRDWDHPVRQIAVRDLGHDQPIFLLTNRGGAAGPIVDRYARRMVIENTIANAIDFFHMDALSATVPMRVDLDLQLTLLGDMLYRLLGTRVGGKYATATPRTLFRNLIKGHATVDIQPTAVHVRTARRASNPLLRAARFDGPVGPIPWWDNRILHLEIG